MTSSYRLHSSFLDGSFEVIIFTESWLHKNCADNLIGVKGYSHFRLDRQTTTNAGTSKKGGGILIYVKDGINVTTWPTLDVSDQELETLSLTCKMGMHRNTNITVVYRPPSGRVQPAIDKLETIIEGINSTTSGDSVVIGDLNIDLLTDNVHARRLNQFANYCRLKQIITSPTRVTHKTGTLIDYIYTNAPYVCYSSTLDCNITDHLPVFLVLKKCRSKPQYKEIFARSFRDFDLQAFSDDINSINLDNVFSDDDPEGVWDRLYTQVCFIVDAHCPLGSIRATIGKPPYLNDHILALMREQDRAFHKVRKRNTPDNWRLARLFRACVAKEVRAARKNYILSQIRRADGDGKKFWRTINSSFFNKTSSPITQIFAETNQLLLDGVDAAKEINSFFCHISTSLSSKFTGKPS